MATRKIFNVKSVKERKYHTLDIGKYKEVFGMPEGKFVAIFYGPAGSGKSSFALQFADFYAKNFGKVLYNSHEEGVRQTLRDRIVEFNVDSAKLYFGNAISFDEMMYKIQRNYYRLVIIDSVQYMGFTYAQLKELRETFQKRHLSIIMVSFGTKNQPLNAKDHFHASDIKAYFEGGKVHVVSRYLGRVVNKVLFRESEVNQQMQMNFN